MLEFSNCIIGLVNSPCSSQDNFPVENRETLDFDLDLLWEKGLRLIGNFGSIVSIHQISI